jgi:hypothetical protein
MPTLLIIITSYYRLIAAIFFIFMIKNAHIAPQGICRFLFPVYTFWDIF